MKTLILENGQSQFFLVDRGMGGFLNPPDEAEHNYSISEYERGHNVGSYSLRGAIQQSWIPEEVKNCARTTLFDHPGKDTAEWRAQVEAYFAHCYSPDGKNRSASDCIIDKNDSLPRERSLAYLHIKIFFPNATA